jgi:hypothetical protein
VRRIPWYILRRCRVVVMICHDHHDQSHHPPSPPPTDPCHAPTWTTSRVRRSNAQTDVVRARWAGQEPSVATRQAQTQTSTQAALARSTDRYQTTPVT